MNSALSLRNRLRSNPVLRFVSSLELTVVCLTLLFILTFWGTIAQVHNGLYDAQERFFLSWFFFIFHVIPFPGGRLVLWVLFCNLASVLLLRFVYTWSRIGLLITHTGLLFYFVAAFFTFHGAVESHLQLMEGHGSNVSVAYYRWELAFWKKGQGSRRAVTAVDSGAFRPGETIRIDRPDVTVRVKRYYINSKAFLDSAAGPGKPVNGSGITSLASQPPMKRPEANMPGGVFDLKGPDGRHETVLLYGAEDRPTTVSLGGKMYEVRLQRKRYVLPFILTLKKFKATFHPGTEMAESYQSRVQINTGKTTRDVLISMNEPLRYKGYTFYQASYALDKAGQKYSIFAVVRNSGRLLPYIAAFLTFLGLLIHFSINLARYLKEKQPA